MKAAHHAAKGHAKKHTHAHKHVHHHHPKHHPKHHKTAHHHHTKARVHTVGRHPAGAKGLALAPGDVACCVSQALAESLRLRQGLPVTGEDVLALYWHTADDPDAGATIAATLDAAARVGLAERRPVFAEYPLDGLPLPFGQLPGHVKGVDLGEVDHYFGVGLIHGLILGVDLPGPHAVLATPEGWWSWGELFCPWCEFPDAVIDEAWAVSWQ